jgi:hypothetical protein
VQTLNPYDAILISQHFSDHCHEETLALLDKKCPIFSTPKGTTRLQKAIDKNRLKAIPNFDTNEWINYGDLHFSCLKAPIKTKATFSGIILRKDAELIVYCPHGYELTSQQKKQLANYRTIVLITSFSSFRLPFYLGGAVNPGLSKASQLVNDLKPQHLLATHDEQKHAEGLVSKLSKTYYPSTEELTQLYPQQFIPYENLEQEVLL